MKQQSVRPRKGANCLDFIRRVNRPELRRLCDANGVHHVPVQLDLLRDEFFCLAQVDLSVVGFRQKQFGSPGIKLRSAAFIRLDVGALVTDHSVEGLAKLGQTERVRPSAGEHKINIAIDFRIIAGCVRTPRRSIRPRRKREHDVHSPAPRLSKPRDKSLPCCRWQNGDESRQQRIGPLLREFCRLTISDKRLPDSGALGLRICQANPFSIFAPRSCVTAVSFLFRNSACRVSVFPSKFLHLIIAFCCILPNAQAQTNLRQ